MIAAPRICSLRVALAAMMVVGATLAGRAFPVAAEEPKTEWIPRAPVRDPEHIFQRRAWSWQELRTRNIVMQRRDYSCGAAALATMARYYLGDKDVGEDYFLDALDQLLTHKEVEDRIKNGLALSDLRRVADKTGYEAVVTELTFEKLSEAKVPLLVGIAEDDYKHFVVYRGTNFRWVYLADPIRGHIRMTPNQFTKAWQKNLALAISKPNQDVPKVHGLSLSEGDLFWGETTDQLLRTQSERDLTRRPWSNPK
jgi:predicted double-glycine peptidase